MPALGEEFRSAREARGLSLSDVAERLHIRSVYLAAIEDEDWQAIGAPVYVRGFMRTYARFLGLDAEAAVDRFSTGAGNTPAPNAPARLEDRSRGRRAVAEPSSPSVVAILAVVVAVAVVAYVSYVYVQYRIAGPPPPIFAPATPYADAAAIGVPADAASPAGSQMSPADSATPPPVVHHAVKRGIVLALTQTSWIRVTVDGTVVAEGTYPPGTAKSFTGRVADVRAGNAGGVGVTVNGRAIGKLGNPGDVVERRFVLSGE